MAHLISHHGDEAEVQRAEDNGQREVGVKYEHGLNDSE